MMDIEQVTTELRVLRDRLVRDGQGLTDAHRARFLAARDLVDDRIEELGVESGPNIRERLARVPARLQRLEGLLETREGGRTALSQQVKVRAGGTVAIYEYGGSQPIHKVGTEPLTLTKTTPTINRRARLTPICRDDLVSDGYTVWVPSF
jgi:hypothetical protein